MKRWIPVILAPLAAHFFLPQFALSLGAAVAKTLQCDGFGCLVLALIPLSLVWVLPVLASVFVVSFIILKAFPDYDRKKKIFVIAGFGLLLPLTIQFVQQYHFRTTNLNSLVFARDTEPLRKRILEKNFNPNEIIPATGATLLAFILCNTQQHLSLVPILLQMPEIDVNRAYEDGDPLGCAIRKSLMNEAHLLISHPTIRLTNGRLLQAIEVGSGYYAIPMLKTGQFPVNAILDSTNEFPSILGAAASVGNTEVVSYLLKAPQIDVNIPDARGMTPLLIAVYANKRESVSLLLNDTRTNIAAKDAQGRDIIQLANLQNVDSGLKAIITEKLSSHPHE